MKVYGRIIDAYDKEPLPSAKIFISDASGELVKPLKSVTTQENGNFSIEVMPQDYIYVVYVGFYDKIIPVTEFSSKRKIIPIRYKDEIQKQVVTDRVVSTEYGTLKSRGLGFWGWSLVIGTSIYLIEKYRRNKE
jgi:hypothetical protein